MNPIPGVDAPGRILVVDDLEGNRELVGDYMESAGHNVRLAPSAEKASLAIHDWNPDVILLDVMMPNVNGMEFCRKLKADPVTAAVPIILMTAQSDKALRIRGIEAGANDFLLKPIESHEVTLRVRNALRSKRLYDGMKRDHEELRRLETLRDGMTHMLVHDLRSPLMGIGMCLEALKDGAENGDRALIADDARSCIRITGILTEMIGTILDVSRMEAGAMPVEPLPCDLTVILEDGLARVRGGATVPIELNTEHIVVSWDQSLVARAIANLVANALKYAAGMPVWVRCHDQGDAIEIQIDDAGPGVPVGARESIFEKFGSLGTGDGKRHSTGLGLHFCKQVATAHGGSIGVSSLEPKGSRFWMRLPKTALKSNLSTR